MSIVKNSGLIDLSAWKTPTSTCQAFGCFFMVFYETDELKYSNNGYEWNSITLPKAAKWKRIKLVGNALFILADYDSFYGNNEYAYSTDGIAWALKTFPGTYTFEDVTVDKFGNHFAVTSEIVSCAVYKSFDLITWDPQGVTYTGLTSRYTRIEYGNDLYVITANFSFTSYASSMWSTDGYTWVIGTSAIDESWTDLIFVNGYFILAGYHNRIAYSTDGGTWTEKLFTTGYEVKGISAYGLDFVVLCQFDLDWYYPAIAMYRGSTPDNMTCIYTANTPLSLTEYGSVNGIAMKGFEYAVMCTDIFAFSPVYMYKGLAVYLASTPEYGLITDDYIFTKAQPAKSGELVNSVEVSYYTPYLQDESTLFTSEEISLDTPLNGGNKKTVLVSYSSSPAKGVYAEASGVSVDISSASFYSWGGSIEVTNTGSEPVYTIITVKGRAVTFEQSKVVVEDSISIVENGRIGYSYPENKLIQTEEAARLIANGLLTSYSRPRKDIAIEWIGNPALELGDSIKVYEYDKGSVQTIGEFLVFKNKITFDGTLREATEGRKI
jgi:hypothetical protein